MAQCVRSLATILGPNETSGQKECSNHYPQEYHKYILLVVHPMNIWRYSTLSLKRIKINSELIRKILGNK